jgi:hypothetical protein
MYFIVIAVLGLVVFRKIGRALSKKVFYLGPGWIVGFGTAVWGALMATLVFLLIFLLHPNLFVEVAFGWLLGAYLAIPNYGLWHSNSLPDSLRDRHRFLSTRPLISYLCLAAWLAFLVHAFPRR